ncbi:hypothetical protein CDAR_188481 [Caerostris darwini]|uniref:Uncharacterized protein n=1 Tax=Caerostris darwini TaxID=1538125 RepID=A0AAV4V6N8_9ARAC|nr:hypothetical protein CDAR_188351 [Caerostris darwini]GIY65771.1 hypothetical protein CDAR_188481 [Caerostris darwini]
MILCKHTHLTARAETNDSPRAASKLPSRPQGLKITRISFPLICLQTGGFQKGIERKISIFRCSGFHYTACLLSTFRFKEKEGKNLFKEVPRHIPPSIF